MQQLRRSQNLSDLAKVWQCNPLIFTSESLLSEIVEEMNAARKSAADLENRDYGYVLIVEGEELVGIFTESDLVGLVASGIDFANTPIAEVMRQPVVIARSQCQDLATIWSFLQQHALRYVPVLGDRHEVLGVITLERLLQNFNPIDSNSSERSEIIEPPAADKLAENQLERFFAVTPTLFCLAGFDGYFKRLNPIFSQTLGYSERELLAEPFVNFVHPEDRAATLAELERVKQGQTTIAFENRYRTKAGEYRWLLWTAKPYREEQTIYAAAIDISDRKEAEQKLARSENLLRAIFESEPECVKLLAADGTLLDINAAGLRTIEAESLDRVRGKSIYPLVIPEHRQAFIDLIESIFEGKSGKLEFQIIGLKGTPRWLETHAVPFRSSDGTTCLLAVTRDISDRKRAELLLKQERDFTTAILDTVGALVAVFDRQGRIIKFNRTCERITGYTFSEVKDQLVWQCLIAPEEKEMFQAVFQRLLAGQLRDRYETYWLAKDGSRHLISWSDSALLDSKGEIEFIIATGIEVTQQRQIQNRLAHQYRQTQLLAEVTRKIRMSTELDTILQTTVTEIQQLLACDRVTIVKLRSNNTAVPISEAVLPELTPMLGYELADPLLVGKYSARYRQGKILAISDIYSAEIAPEVKELLGQFQVRAKLVVPIISQSNLQGLFVAHQCYSPREWQASEIELLQQLADQISVALSQAQLLNNLEELVAERTEELTAINQLLQAEISERQQTEIALRENQQKLAGILDNADEAIVSIDETQRVRLFNQGAERIFGYQADEVMGQSLDLLLPEAFREIHRQHISNFGSSLDPSRSMTERNSNVCGRRKNGEEFPAEASISKLRSRDGLLFTVMLKDITERQQAAAKLRASEALLAKAEKIAKMGSWEYNLVTKKLSWSRELFRILGFAADRTIPDCQQIFRFIHPEDRALVRKTLRQGHTEGKSWQFNYRLLDSNGRIRYLESRGEPTVNRQGKVLKVWGTIMDITERKQAELSLQRSEEQLQLITDSLPVLIAYADRQQRYRYNNRTYEIWFGKSRQELLGLHISEVVGQSHYHKILPYIETALSGKSVSFELELTQDWGKTRWINATYVPDRSFDGKVEGFFAMIEDISERKAIEQMKSEFVSVTSHEMRTPLTSIHGVLKLLCAQRMGNLNSSGREMAQLALRNSERLIRLVNDVLDLEKLEFGGETLERQWCDSVELIDGAMEAVADIAKQQQITIETDTQAIELWVDRDRILQTLTNLLSNAIKFSATENQVWITCQRRGDEVLFSVKDRGRGIPSDKLDTIFERFQQVDASDSRQKGGTGLGLTICRHIVEQHGGRIWVESVFGQGSTFFFTLPQQ